MLGLGSNISYSNDSLSIQASTEILNRFSGSSIGFSFRRLKSSYNGPCVRVVNDSNASLDIGFSNSYIDTSAIASHCGSGDGRVSIWYDQTGNSRDVVQSTATARPLIYDSGSMVELSGRVALLFDGGDRLLSGSSHQLHTGSFYAAGVVKSPSTIGDEIILAQDDDQSSPNVRIAQYLRTKGSSSSARIVVFNTSGSSFNDDSTSIGTSSALVLSSQAFSNGVIESFDNSEGNIRGAYFGTLNTGSMNFSIGAATGSTSITSGFNGHILEVILWGSDQSSSRTDIEADMNRFYDVF